MNFLSNVRCLLLIVILLPALVSCSALKGQSSSPLPEYHYLFYQPWLADIADWDEEFWQRELGALRSRGVTTLVIQWGQFEEVGILNQERFGEYIASVVTSAASNDIEVVLGLYGEMDTFRVFDNEDTDLEQHLDYLRRRHIETADWYLEHLSSTENVIGWYLPEEISDKLIADESTRAIMLGHTLAMREQLPRLGHSTSIYISAYCSNLMQGERLSQGVGEGLVDGEIKVFLQAGNGVSEDALASCRETNRLLPSSIWVVEMFIQREDGHQVTFESRALEETLRNYSDEHSPSDLAVFSFRYLPRQPINSSGE
jgi:hypothetical protein